MVSICFHFKINKKTAFYKNKLRNNFLKKQSKENNHKTKTFSHCWSVAPRTAYLLLFA